MKISYTVSVVIPIYNAERTIEDCINCIVKQTLTSWQLILVNDGSTDGTKTLIEKYKEDSRIVIYEQENQGVSVARNKGIELATGKYMFFLDSDDIIDEDLLQKAFDFAEENMLDLVTCGHIERNSTNYNKNYSNHETFVATDKNEISKCFLTLTLKNASAKLFLTDVIKKNNITFPVGMNLGEDWYFTYSFMFHVKRIGNLQDVFYHVRNVNDFSLSKRFIENMEKDIEKRYELWQKICKHYDGLEEYFDSKRMNYGLVLAASYFDNLYRSPHKRDKFQCIKVYIKTYGDKLIKERGTPSNLMEKVTAAVLMTKNSILIAWLFRTKNVAKKIYYYIMKTFRKEF